MYKIVGDYIWGLYFLFNGYITDAFFFKYYSIYCNMCFSDCEI